MQIHYTKVLGGILASLLASLLAPAAGAGASRTNDTQSYFRRHSVSGLSAGGSMAAQHAVVFSSIVDGVAILAGSPYGCGALGRDFDA